LLLLLLLSLLLFVFYVGIHLSCGGLKPTFVFMVFLDVTEVLLSYLRVTCRKLHVERLSLPGQPGHNCTNIYTARKDRYHIYNNIYVVITDTVSTVTRYDKLTNSTSR
jgi:hypothetical protein